MVKTINFNGKIVDISTPIVMGILNITDDSFYDGGKYRNINEALKQIKVMLREGADIIDIGAQSTRPRAIQLSVDEEISRLQQIIPIAKKEFPNAILSIDTFYGAVADKALSMGADMINDISGGDFDPTIFDIVAKYKCPYVLMHHKGTPSDMQINPQYQDVTLEVTDYFIQKIGELHQKGVYDIILDLGYGFGKTLEHNYTLLKNSAIFSKFNMPILTGISRKSMVYKLFNTNSKEALNGTTALHMFALMNGSKILRVHDVKEAKEVITLYNQLS